MGRKCKESDDPCPSSTKRKHLGLLFPFMMRRGRIDDDPMDKFCHKMDPRCVRSFTIFGPLRCLDSPFSSLEISGKDFKPMLQQILPSLGIFSSRSRFLDLEQGAEPKLNSGEIPLGEDASEEDFFRVGRADYALRTIPKASLEKFRKKHPEINWNNPNKLELARTVFQLIDAALTRTDAIIDCQSDCVRSWDEKTLPQLVSYGNQLALENMKNGFAPRPIYLLAIDKMVWKLAILDPHGVIRVNEDGEIQGLKEFEEQQEARAEWIKKKSGEIENAFGAVLPYTKVALEKILQEAQMKHRSNGVAEDEYVVSNLWVECKDFVWNGGGFKVQFLFPGTLILFEGLLRLVCGERICRAGWTSQRLRMLFGRQHEIEIARCLNFERASKEWSKPRSLTCSDSKELVAATVEELAAHGKWTGDEFRNGFMAMIEWVRSFVQSLARFPCPPADILTLARLYGGEECAELLGGEEAAKAIGEASIRHFIVHNDMVEADRVHSLKAAVIPVERSWYSKLDIQEYTLLLCNDLSSCYRFWSKLFQPWASAGLVIIAREVDKETRRMLRRVNIDAAIFEVSSGCLDALQDYLHAELADNQKAEFQSCIKHHIQLSLYRNDLIVIGEAKGDGDSGYQPVSVVEMRISGATRGDFLERRVHMQAAATAISSALAKGVVSASVFAAAWKSIPAEIASPAFNAGAGIVANVLKVAYLSHPKADRAVAYAREFQRQTIKESMTYSNQADLVESVEETLFKMVDIFNCAFPLLRLKRARPALVEEAEAAKMLGFGAE